MIFGLDERQLFGAAWIVADLTCFLIIFFHLKEDKPHAK